MEILEGKVLITGAELDIAMIKAKLSLLLLHVCPQLGLSCGVIDTSQVAVLRSDGRY